MFAILKIVLFLTVGLFSNFCTAAVTNTEGGLSLECDSECTLPPYPHHGRYTIFGGTESPNPGSIVPENFIILYQCNEGYEPSMNPAICISGQWETEFEECKKKVTCLLPASPSNGSYNVSGSIVPLLPQTEVPNLTLLMYSCNAAFDLIGNSTAYCWQGNWSVEPPVCQKNLDCVLPDLPEGGSYSIVGTTEAPVPGAVIAEKEALRYNCTSTYIFRQDHVIVCSNGKWLPRVANCFDFSNCEDVAGHRSGVYTIKPTQNGKPFDAYCELALAGQKWTVIQQRFSEEVDFYRSYKEYSEGFGDVTGNHWLGLERIHEITKDGHHELYVELEAHNGTKAYARYDTFIVGNSSTGFQLTISGYTGTAGDAMFNTGYDYWKHNGMKFTTFDKDQDAWSAGNCAYRLHGGWWYADCASSNINGRYFNVAVNVAESMCWDHLFDFKSIALKKTRMLIRRK